MTKIITNYVSKTKANSVVMIKTMNAYSRKNPRDASCVITQTGLST